MNRFWNSMLSGNLLLLNLVIRRLRRLLMKRNRKKVETYRFNGYPHLHAGSIHSVTIADLYSRIQALEAKLADPDEADDKRWTERWLSRYRAELSKKLQGLALKTEERSKLGTHRRERLTSESPKA